MLILVYYENPKHVVFTVQKCYDENHCFHPSFPVKTEFIKADTILTIADTQQVLKKIAE